MPLTWVLHRVLSSSQHQHPRVKLELPKLVEKFRPLIWWARNSFRVFPSPCRPCGGLPSTGPTLGVAASYHSLVADGSLGLDPP